VIFREQTFSGDINCSVSKLEARVMKRRDGTGDKKRLKIYI
jgi:hypothetical protein